MFKLKLNNANYENISLFEKKIKTTEYAHSIATSANPVYHLPNHAGLYTF